MTTPETIREQNLSYLNQHGFKPATWMPVPATVGEASQEPGFSGGTLRPAIEIANRFLCHSAVFAWGSAPDEFEEAISKFVANNSLRNHMTSTEVDILDMPKPEAREQFSHSVGWRLENMWSLAWLLGLAETPSAITGQITDEITGPMMALILPSFELTAESLIAGGTIQTDESAVATEDLFYLAHNAVRSGQTGNLEQVPDGFDPVGDGGAIHERRHSLTWALSPGTSWNETDLST